MKQDKFCAIFQTLHVDELTPDELARTTLPIADLRIIEDVFQPRDMQDADTQAASERQIEQLLMNLERAKERDPKHGGLDPILVTKIDGQWTVVEGHHRYFAYVRWQAKGGQTRGRQRTMIPVKVVGGSPDEIVSNADVGNFKDKQNVPEGDKLNRAWNWTKLGKDPKWIMERTGVGPTTAYDMRKAKEQLLKDHPSKGWWEFPWKKITKMLKPREGNMDERGLRVHQFKTTVLKGCAHRPKQHPHDFFEAVFGVYPEIERTCLDWLSERRRKGVKRERQFEEEPTLEMV